MVQEGNNISSFTLFRNINKMKVGQATSILSIINVFFKVGISSICTCFIRPSMLSSLKLTLCKIVKIRNPECYWDLFGWYQFLSQNEQSFQLWSLEWHPRLFGGKLDLIHGEERAVIIYTRKKILGRKKNQQQTKNLTFKLWVDVIYSKFLTFKL